MSNQKYTGVKFYFRDINEWGNFLKLTAGFDGNFVQDKTTDSANISFIVQDEPNYLILNTWAALFIGADSPELEFNEDGTPKNHEQFIVGGYQYVKTQWGYQVSMKLVEPIERFRGVLGETLSYHSRGEYEESGIKYPARIYNYYTALKRWLQVTPANTDNISRDSEEKDPNGIAWWNRITILDKDFLSGFPFADDTLNELTLYDLLLDVYDSGTGRTPVAYFDLNTATGMPRRFDRDEYLLKFIVQDGTDKPVLEWDDLTAHKGYGEVCTSVMRREDGANYATGIVSNITNLSPSNTVTFPAEGVYISPRGVAETRDTTKMKFTEQGTEQWGVFPTHKIKDVKSVKGIQVSNSQYSYSIEHFDRSVLERKQRDAVTELDEDGYKNYDMYDEGDDILYTQNYQYDKNAKNTLLYSFEYEPLIDARVCLGDTEYVRQINQNASQVDSEKFGRFTQSYLAGMGKADYIIQRTTENPQEYINLIGSRVMRKYKEYMITNVSFRNRNLQFDVFFQLNENHMRKNMSYQAPQNIRSNTTIQYDNLRDRKVNLKDIMKLAVYPEGDLESPKYLDRDAGLAVLNALIPVTENESGVSKDYYPQFVNILAKKCDDDNISSNEQKSSNVAPFVFGNAICFNTKFQDNAISGMKTEFTKIDEGYSQYGRVYQQYPMLYTNTKGEAEKTSLDIISVVEDNVKDGTYAVDMDKDEEAINTIRKMVGYASGIYNRWLPARKKIISIPKMNLQKDMMEEYNITYSLEVSSGNERLEVFPDMLKYSRLINPDAQCEYLKAVVYSGSYGDGEVLGEYTINEVRRSPENYVPKSLKMVVPMPEEIKPKSILIKSKIKGVDGYVNCLLLKKIAKYNFFKNTITIQYIE